MLEVEAKFQPHPSDIERLREQLGNLHDIKPTYHEQEDIYFSHPHRDLKARDEALRLRVDKGLQITWKGPKLDPPLKTREEIEFGLETDLSTAASLLRALGFTEAARVHKTRHQWKLTSPEEAWVCIDEVRDLGTFVEVEVRAHAPSEGRATLVRVLQFLDLTEQTLLTQSYLGLLQGAPNS